MPNYAHVDADCFYVSCERIRDSLLDEKPVAVLGNQGACVIAASYEMKASGVEVAMPIWKAKKICPEGVFIKRDFRWYGLLSHAMQEVLTEFSDHIEYYSVDESFLDLGEVYGPLLTLAQRVQKRMMIATGLPVSVGIAPTRTLCKLASKTNKPLGTMVIHDGNRDAILSTMPIGKVNGIGRQLLKRCHQYGIYTAEDFVRKGRRTIKQIFFKPGEMIWYELQGQPILPIKPERETRKIVSRGGSLWGHFTDREYIWGFALRNMDRFLTALWDDDLEVRRFTVVLVKSDGGTDSFMQNLPDYSNQEATLTEALKVCFNRAFKQNTKYMRMHIIGEPVRLSSEKQLNLFEASDEDLQAIKKLKVAVNKRFGLFTLRNASTANAKDVFKDKVSDFEIVDIPDKHLF